MDVRDAVRRRRSVRSYADREVDREVIESLFDRVRFAPSARNKQDWRFVVVDDDDRIEEVYRRAGRQPFVREAPAVVAGVTTDPDYVMSCDVPGGVVDLAIALDHLSLLAVEEGLGTCWIGDFDQDAVRDLLGVPSSCLVVGLMTLGYPSKPLTPVAKDRKETSEILAYDAY